MKLNDERLAFIRENRHMEPKKLAKALGVSVRHVERALREMGDADALRRAKVRRVAVAVIALAALGVAVFFGVRWKKQHDEATAAVEKKRRDAESKKVEQAIYASLDKGERGREDEIVARLADESESVRLAAIRYLLAQPSTKHVAQVLGRVDDPSDRVRLATLQMLGTAPGEAVSQKLLRAAGEKSRAIQERVIALNSLRARPVAEVRPHARGLLDCLTEQAAVQRAAHELLASLHPEVKVTFTTDASLRASWQSALEVRQ